MTIAVFLWKPTRRKFLRKPAKAGIDAVFVQDNHSRSRRGTLRGLHYQVQQAQGKLVRVVTGEIFDVVVDLRRASPYFFAHGFYVLSEWADFLYKVTDYYAPQWERTLLWNDPAIGIEWPLLNGELPQLSAKDSQGLPFNQLEVY